VYGRGCSRLCRVRNITLIDFRVMIVEIRCFLVCIIIVVLLKEWFGFMGIVHLEVVDAMKLVYLNLRYLRTSTFSPQHKRATMDDDQDLLPLSYRISILVPSYRISKPRIYTTLFKPKVQFLLAFFYRFDILLYNLFLLLHNSFRI